MTDEQRAHIERALSTLVNLQPIIANGLLDRRQLAFIDPHHEIAMEALEAVLIAEQAEPVEPVAWLTPGQDLHLNNGEGFRFSDWTPLYTAPPQRKPLTDEDIEACRQQGYAHAGLSAPFDFGKAARAIERAHNITDTQIADHLARHGIPMP